MSSTDNNYVLSEIILVMNKQITISGILQSTKLISRNTSNDSA